MARIAPVARLVLLLAACGPLSRASWAAEPGTPPLILERTIPIQGSGRIDHMAVDLRRGRLFVAELGNGSVDVVDLATGRAVHRFAGLREPQGVGYLGRDGRQPWAGRFPVMPGDRRRAEPRLGPQP